MARRKKNPELCDCRWNNVTGKREWCERHKQRKNVKEYKRPRYEPLSPDKILEMIRGVEDPLAKAYIALEYLTGGRVSEVARVWSSHIRKEEDFYFVRMVVLKKRKQKGMMRVVPIPRKHKAKCHEDELMEIVYDYLATTQRREYPFWVWGRPTEYNMKGRPDLMSKYLARHCQFETEAQVKGRDEYWWPRLIKKALHSHFLRHCRRDHLQRYYKFDALTITSFFRWSDPRQAMIYGETQKLEYAFG